MTACPWTVRCVPVRHYFRHGWWNHSNCLSLSWKPDLNFITRHSATEPNLHYISMSLPIDAGDHFSSCLRFSKHWSTYVFWYSSFRSFSKLLDKSFQHIKDNLQCSLLQSSNDLRAFNIFMSSTITTFLSVKLLEVV